MVSILESVLDPSVVLLDQPCFLPSDDCLYHVPPGVTERSNAATEERLKSGHAVGAMSIV